MNKKIVNILRWSVLLLILIGAYWIVSSQKVKQVEKGTPVEISFLGLKEDADCTLIQQGNLNVIIDTGEKQDGYKIINYLKEKKVETIEYLILTHPDLDHIGGAVDIMDNFKVKNIIQPYYPKKKEELNNIGKKAEDKGVAIIYPTLTRKFTIGEINLTVYPPLEKNYSKDNNYSIVTLVNHGKVNMLFAGDAEKKRLEEIMLIKWENISLCKIPHHGRANINSEPFIKAIKPSYGVVTSKDADELIKEACKVVNTQLLYTGTGDKIFQSDGQVLTKEGLLESEKNKFK